MDKEAIVKALFKLYRNQCNQMWSTDGDTAEQYRKIAVGLYLAAGSIIGLAFEPIESLEWLDMLEDAYNTHFLRSAKLTD